MLCFLSQGLEDIAEDAGLVINMRKNVSRSDPNRIKG